MLITDKENKNYAYVGLEDILTAITLATDEKIKQELSVLFKSESYNEVNKIRISKKSNIYKAIKNTKGVINGDEHITPSILSEALSRAIYEFNYDMKKKLLEYFRKFMDNLALNQSNELLVHQILCDEKVINYIRKYDSLDDYVNELAEKRLRKKTNDIPTNDKEKSKSLVLID